MTNVIEKNYVVVKSMNWNEYLEWDERYSYRFPWYSTDIFNKASKTTICLNGAYDTSVMYCDHCNETHYNHMDMILELRYYRDGESDSKKFEIHIAKVVCEKCGSSYNLEDVRIINRARHARNSHIRLIYDKVYDDDNELVKFSIKTCSMVVERAFYFVDNRYKVIFNTKTGQTYLYDNPANRKNKVRPISNKATLTSINNSAIMIDDVLNKSFIDTENPEEYKVNKVKEIYNIIYKKVSNNLGYKPKTLEEYAEEVNITNESEKYTFQILAIFNRFPNINPFKLVELKAYDNNISILKRMRKIKNTSKYPLVELAKAYNIKHFDLFEKYFYSDKPKKIYWLIVLSMFFDNKEYLEKLIDCYDDYNYLVNDSFDVDMFVKNRYSIYNAESLLFKDIRKVISEEDMYGFIKSYIDTRSKSEEISDLANLYYVIKKKLNTNVKLDMKYLYSLLCKGNNEDEEFDGVIFSRYEASSSDAINYLYEKLDESSYSKNQKKFKFRLSTLNEYRNNVDNKKTSNNILISSLYNYVPIFNPYLLAEMLFSMGILGRGIRSQCEYLIEFNVNDYIKDNGGDILGGLFKEFNIPNVKSLKTKILKNPKQFAVLALYSNMFKDVNLLNNIIDSEKNSNGFYFESLQVKRYFEGKSGNKHGDYVLEYIHKLTEQLILEQGETIAAKKIARAYKDNRCNHLVDIWPMYENHLKLYPNEKVDLTGSIVEIHDRLVGLTGGSYSGFTKADFKRFKYSEEEEKLNGDIDGYTFNLAHNGRELAILGNELKNCVRSYVKRARKKECIIVAVTHNDKYKICIELKSVDKDRYSEEDSSYKYELHQAKLYANTRVSNDKEALRVVLEWMDRNNIKGCSSDLIVHIDKRVISNQEAQGIIQGAQFDVNLPIAVGEPNYNIMEIEENGFQEIDDDDIPF